MQTRPRLVLCVLVVLTACTAASHHIGFVAPLTGDAAQYGTMEQRATQLALNQTNVDMKLIFKDGKCSGNTAATVARQLINTHNVEVILGGLCSGETLAMAPIANDNKVVLFTSTSTSPKISDAGPYVYRNAYSEAKPARATAKLALENGHDTIAIVSAETAFAQSYADMFRTAYTTNGGTIQVDATYSQGTKDFNSIASKVMNADPDAVFLIPQNPTGALLAQRLDQLGYTGGLYGNNVLTGSAVIQEYPSLNGMYVSTAAGLNTTNPRAQAFLNTYEQRYGTTPQLPYFAAARYDSVNIIATAIDQVGYDGANIKDFLDEYTHNGVLGTYHFDANGDIVGVDYVSKQIQNGSLTVVRQ